MESQRGYTNWIGLGAFGAHGECAQFKYLFNRTIFPTMKFENKTVLFFFFFFGQKDGSVRCRSLKQEGFYGVYMQKLSAPSFVYVHPPHTFLFHVNDIYTLKSILNFPKQ